MVVRSPKSRRWKSPMPCGAFGPVKATVQYSSPGSAGRLFAGVQPSGRPLGLLWAERPAGQPWGDAEREYLVLSAKAVERSPAMAALVGPVIDPERLSQRLADAAVIAGRMAHDFDNILTGIIGFSDLALPMLQAGSQAAGLRRRDRKVGQRGIQFTQQLHQLSRSGQTKPRPGRVSSAVAKEEQRLKPQMSPSLRVEKDVPASLPAVAVDGGPLQVALGHLLENAVGACPQGGVVRIAARPIELTEAEARTYLGKPGGGSHLLVTDFGHRLGHEAGSSPAAVGGAVLHDQGASSRAGVGDRLPRPVCASRRYADRFGAASRHRNSGAGGAAAGRRPPPGGCRGPERPRRFGQHRQRDCRQRVTHMAFDLEDRLTHTPKPAAFTPAAAQRANRSCANCNPRAISAS